MVSKVIPDTHLEQRTMSQDMMDELRKSQEALKEELNILKIQMGWVMETLQALFRKEGHPIPIVVTEGATTPHPSGVTPSQGKFYVTTPHLPNKGSKNHNVPIPVPYSKLYPQLIQKTLVTPRALTPTSPYLPWYNPNAGAKQRGSGT
ncbi:hypothetical protein KIW84_013210 [Lathyrus oleraceus]|uniref:Uncharacterized protein n=1 Tax=Pisum sativum TaxID=3888 RepID=A0A9D5GXF5_PEA|nr:hypothetical protein KIW84_013210 [Pisum sativum]